MNIVYAQEPFPEKVTRTIFLAGPSPRKPSDPDWRPEALAILKTEGFDGHVFVPLPRDGEWQKNYEGQVEWEEEGLNRADCILFWCPRDMASLPGLATNDEWGAWKDSGKVVWGSPEGAPHTSYQRYYANKLGAPRHQDLLGTVMAAILMVGENGAEREGGACQVPLLVWKHPTFKAWYKVQTEAGNSIKRFRVKDTWRVGKTRSFLFAFSAHVTLNVGWEGREKTEYLFARTDLTAALLYTPGTTLSETRIALVKEVRLPARTYDGCVHELPGGSCKDTAEATKAVVLKEISEELGVTIAEDSIDVVHTRQAVSTLSAHNITLFATKITVAQMDAIEKAQYDGKAYGVESDSERTYPDVWYVHQIINGHLVDWATLGMILQVLVEEFDF